MITRRHFVTASTGLACALAGLAPPARAQVIARAARMLVGFSAGGSIDVAARLLVEQIKDYAPSMYVDNVVGAGGRTALAALKAGVADGSVLALTPGDQITLFPHVYNKLGYDPIGDFAPVTTVCTVQFLLIVGPLVPAQVTTLADFVEWCRANPKLATFGTSGVGARPHFLGAALSHAAGFEFTHVPYKGGTPATQDVLGGQIAAAINVISTVLPYVQSGGVRALATTAPQRSSLLPKVPTMREAGYPACEAVEWFGVFVPAATSREIVTALNGVIRHALKSDAIMSGLAKQSFGLAGSSPDDFAQLIKSDTDRWGEIVKSSEFKPID
jgi:tripartite-type tricarboxylate transporter receptor subunit TctC